MVMWATAEKGRFSPGIFWAPARQPKAHSKAVEKIQCGRFPGMVNPLLLWMQAQALW
jgi:hypothetical protein